MSVIPEENKEIFQEGSSIELLPFHRGAVCVARATERPIVPIGISKGDASGIVLNVGEPAKIGYENDLLE